MMSYPALPYLNGQISTLTFAGHSAGCQFSNTMLVIHSATIKGAGLMECGPYALDLPDFHVEGVTTEELVDRSLKALNTNATDGMIDSPDHLKESAIYLVGGTEDTTVPMLAVQAVDNVFTNQGVTKMEFLKKPIKHSMGDSKPIDGIKYLYT